MCILISTHLSTRQQLPLSPSTVLVIVKMSGEPECGEAQTNDLELVTIDSITPDGMQFTDFSDSPSKVVFSLRMTKRHIHEWAYNKHKSFVSQLNKSTDGNVVKIDDHCDRIEKNLSSRVRKIRSELSKKAPGRQHQYILDQPYNFFCPGK